MQRTPILRRRRLLRWPTRDLRVVSCRRSFANPVRRSPRELGTELWYLSEYRSLIEGRPMLGLVIIVLAVHCALCNEDLASV